MTRTYFTPGRVNLIGEHLDYNGGLVLPAALTMGVKATVSPRNDNKVVLKSATHSFQKEIDLADDLFFNSANDWTNYPIGVIAQLKKEGLEVNGCEIIYYSNLPEGSGLSSSAAVEVLTAYFLLKQSNASIDLVWLANFCKEVENNFIGVQCGIMDQYAVALGKAENALLINCATLKHNYIPLQLGDYELVIMNTKKPRNLIHSKYNERKAECEEALRILQTTSGINHLVEADITTIDLIKDPTVRKRARHVISENLRVIESVKVLINNDLFTFGKLMNASHQSLKNDYEVTGTELDALVDEAQKIKNCLGARMTGAGFGGCAIALVHKSALEEFKNTVSEKYFLATGLNCEIYNSQIGDGVHEITS